MHRISDEVFEVRFGQCGRQADGSVEEFLRGSLPVKAVPPVARVATAPIIVRVRVSLGNTGDAGLLGKVSQFLFDAIGQSSQFSTHILGANPRK